MSHLPIYSDAEIIANHRRMAHEALELDAVYRLRRTKDKPVHPEQRSIARPEEVTP